MNGKIYGNRCGARNERMGKGISNTFSIPGMWKMSLVNSEM